MTFSEQLERKGIEKGVDRGRQKCRKEVALSMLREGVEAAFIAKVTGLARSEVGRLKQLDKRDPLS